MNVAVVILAAGASTRMGRPKLLLPWQGTTVIGHLIGQWQTLGADPIALVCPANHTPLLEAIDERGNHAVRCIINPQPERGMFSSIQCAARWDGWPGGLTHWAISLGDQPLVRPDTLERLLAFATVHPDAVCQPARFGRGRHPVLLPSRIFKQLRESAVADFKQFLLETGTPPTRCEMDDAGLDLDLDAPADYETALRLASAVAGRI